MLLQSKLVSLLLVSSIALALASGTQARAPVEIAVASVRDHDVTSARYIFERNSVIAGSSDGRLSVWDSRTGSLVWETQAHTGPLTNVASGPDSRYAITTGWDGSVRVWDLDLKKLHRVYAAGGGGKASWAGRFSPDGRKIVASAGADIFVFDVETGAQLTQLTAHQDVVSGLAFPTAGSLFASASWDGTILIWDLIASRVVARLQGHVGEISAVAISSDGRYLVSGGNDHAVRVWRTEDYAEILTLKNRSGAITAVDITADGSLIAIASSDGTIEVANGQTGVPIAVKKYEKAVHTVAFHPEGKQLVLGGAGMTLRGWHFISSAADILLEGKAESVISLAVAPSGDLLAVGGSRSVSLWDPRTGRKHAHIRQANVGDWLVALSPNGAMLALCGNDSKIRFWSVKDNKIMFVLPEQAHTVTSISFAADGRRLISGSLDGVVKEHDVAGLDALLVKSPQWIKAVSPAPDAVAIGIGGADGDVHVWNGRDKLETRFSNSTSPISAIAYSPSGIRMLVASWDRVIRLWNLSNQTLAGAFRAHQNIISAISISPEGTRAASSDLDGITIVWNLATGELQHKLSGHQGAVSAVSFSPDGEFIYTAGEDGAVRVWNARTSESKAILVSGEDGEWITIASDGSLVSSEDPRNLASATDGARAIDIATLRTELQAPGQVVDLLVKSAGRSENDARALPLSQAFAKHSQFNN